MQRAITLFYIGILLASCDRHSSIAKFRAKDCSIESTKAAFYVTELILFSNDESIDKKQILLSGIEASANKINLCNILKHYNVQLRDINLIAVTLRDSKNDVHRILINSDLLNLIGRDTSILLSEPIQ